MNNYRLLNDWVRVRKCFVPDITDESGKVLIYRTDYDKDTCHWAEIIAVGPKCKVLTVQNVGSKVRLPEMENRLHRLVEDDFVCKESLILDYSGMLYEPTKE